MALRDSETTRAMMAADELMREALLQRLVSLFPLKADASPVYDGFTTEGLRQKVMAGEQADIQSTIRKKHLPAITAAQRPPVADTPLPTWPMVNAMADVARAAGVGLMRYFNTKAFTHSHQLKADFSPSSNADRDAEDVIRSGLRAISTETLFVGEETVDKVMNRRDIGTTGTFWLVDSLDSTRSFIDGYAEFTVNIALIRNGRAAAGVVYAPALNRMYKGLGHQGIATVETPHRERHLHVRTRPPEKRRAVIPYRPADEAALNAFRETNGIRHAFKLSSALRLCAVAEGRADIYPQFGQYAEWDIAAGAAVVEGAGGVMLTMDGQNLTYGNREGCFKMPPLVAASSRAILKIG